MGGEVPGQAGSAKGGEVSLRMTKRQCRLALWALPILVVALIGWMFLEARAMPVLRTTTVEMPFPADAPQHPVRVALITDTHLSGPDSSPERLARIVDMINAQHPDLILLGGDYLGDKKPFGHPQGYAASVTPLGRLHAPLGVVAVLGNHDVFKSLHTAPAAMLRAFPAAGITLLVNQAVRRGPIVIGGVDDFYEGRINIPRTLGAMRALGGVPILLAHTPDVFPALDHWPLVMVGHTHCGQIGIPGYGAIYVPAETRTRYACGRYDENGHTLIVSGGVGTSGLPLRLAAPPDVWIVTIRPHGRAPL
jgi:predicted MPP superfamily phosphohydrolase